MKHYNQKPVCINKQLIFLAKTIHKLCNCEYCIVVSSIADRITIEIVKSIPQYRPIGSETVYMV